jgi:DNA topoisomerase IA
MNMAIGTQRYLSYKVNVSTGILQTLYEDTLLIIHKAINYIKADLTVISPVILTLVIAEMGRRWKNVG